MALLQCRECNETVSNEAKTCPKCGANNPTLKAADAQLAALPWYRRKAFASTMLFVTLILTWIPAIVLLPIIWTGAVEMFRIGKLKVTRPLMTKGEKWFISVLILLCIVFRLATVGF